MSQQQLKHKRDVVDTSQNLKTYNFKVAKELHIFVVDTSQNLKTYN